MEEIEKVRERRKKKKIKDYESFFPFFLSTSTLFIFLIENYKRRGKIDLKTHKNKQKNERVRSLSKITKFSYYLISFVSKIIMINKTNGCS